MALRRTLLWTTWSKRQSFIATNWALSFGSTRGETTVFRLGCGRRGIRCPERCQARCAQANGSDHRGIARFARDKPRDVKLCLHTGATFAGPDIRVLAERAGIGDRLISTDGWLEDHPAIDDERLNLLYNATDVGINTSGGEGWGLISFEHAATGAPQIVPEHSACAELWREVQTTLPIRKEGEHVSLAMMRQFVDPDDVAAVLERLYSDRQFRREQARKAYENALQPAYSWDLIAKQWDDLFQRILALRRP